MALITAHFRRTLLAMAGCWLATVSWAAAPVVTATLEPTQISVGESAQLTITTSSTTMPAPNLPRVTGLDFGIVGQSRRIEIINGAMLATTSTIVRVTPQMPGIFTIPSITPDSQPLVLRVNPDNGSNSSSASRGNFSSLGKPAIVPNGSANGLHLSADGAAFVHLNIPKRDVYVGESIPVDIQVGMRAGFVTSLNGLPTLNGGGDFTLNNLSHQPERSQKLIDGQPFELFTWHSVMAAVKPGKFSLSVETPLTVRVRVRAARDSIIDDLLGDPFMQNFFGSTVSKEINVTSPASELTVVALPTKDRPADFSGAVGAFKISSDLSAPTAAAGDPLTLRMHVTGAGNFDRVDTPMLEHVEHWKTYPPKSTFTAAEATGYKGEKVFEQPLIAAQPGTQTLPALSFSYFDPSTAKYEIAHSAPLTVTISPSMAETAPGAAVPAATLAGTTPPKADTASPAPPVPPAGLRPDHVSSTPRVSSLRPLYLQTRFLAVPGALSLAFVGGWLALRRRDTARTQGQPRAHSKETQRILAQLRASADGGDTAAFFNTAKSALQQRLALAWGIPADRVTTEEVELRLRDDKDADLRYIFAFVDEVNYSGHDPVRIDFPRWIQRIERRLETVPEASHSSANEKAAA